MALFFGAADWIVLAVTACVLLYMYVARNRNYWKNQNVPHESLSIITRSLKHILSKHMCFEDRVRYQKYGRVSGFFQGTRPSLMVAQPELVKQVLVKDFNLLPNRMETDFGDDIFNNMMVMAHVDLWRKIRPASSPAFTTGKLRKMHPLIQDCVKATCEHLEAAAEKDEDVDMKQFYGHYTLDVIARCAFGTKLDSYSDKTSQFVTAVQEAFKFTYVQILSLLFPGLLKALKLKVGADVRYQYFRDLFKRIMAERKEKQQRHEDFLQLMLEAQEGRVSTITETSADAESKLFDIGSETKSTGKMAPSHTLTEDEALAQCVVFFLAGQDTTSSTLACAAYLLALNPDAQEQLRKEVDDCFATHGPEPGLDVVLKLKYLHCVVSETLRIFPAVPRTQRIASTDYVLGDTGIKVPKGATLVIPIFAMHHDPEHFAEPQVFNPDRFSDENVGSIQPYTYLPFGAGPRNCIGMRLALQAVKLCLLHSVHRVQFVRTEKTKYPPEMAYESGTLRLGGIIVGIRKRPEDTHA